MLAGTDSIRDVIAFPKTTAAACLMTAPSFANPASLAKLGIQVVAKEPTKLPRTEQVHAIQAARLYSGGDLDAQDK
ncbi:hypothetical protein ACNKHQ_10805 [Shigella flexneri]